MVPGSESNPHSEIFGGVGRGQKDNRDVGILLKDYLFTTEIPVDNIE